MARFKDAQRNTKGIKPNHTHGEVVGAIAGEFVGGIVGSLAGLPGAVAGIVLGAAAGALAGAVIDQEARRAQIHDGDLDDTIGVTRGNLGRGIPKSPASGAAEARLPAHIPAHIGG